MSAERKDASGTSCGCCGESLSPLEFPGKLSDKKSIVSLFKKISDMFFDDGEKYIAIVDICIYCFSTDCPCKGLAPKAREKLSKIIDSVQNKDKQK